MIPARIHVKGPNQGPDRVTLKPLADTRLVWQIVKKVDLEAQRGPRQNQRRKRNPIEDLRREVSIMRTLRHKNIVSLQVHWLDFLPPDTLDLIKTQNILDCGFLAVKPSAAFWQSAAELGRPVC